MARVKLVQIATIPGGDYAASILALDDQGRLWHQEYGEDAWSRIEAPDESDADNVLTWTTAADLVSKPEK